MFLSGGNNTCSDFEFECSNPVSHGIQKCITYDLVCNKVSVISITPSLIMS